MNIRALQDYIPEVPGAGFRQPDEVAGRRALRRPSLLLPDRVSKLWPAAIQVNRQEA